VVAAVEDVDLPMKKASEYRYLEAFNLSNGRCERIRTFDPLHPMQVRYQAAPHTDKLQIIACSVTFPMGHTEQVAYFEQLAAHQLQTLLGQTALR
jgi:hypothetical protein